MSARKGGVFRHPKHIGERRDTEALKADEGKDTPIRHRDRSDPHKLPDDWSDITPAARKDRGRGKPSHSPARKAAAKAKWKGTPD